MKVIYVDQLSFFPLFSILARKENYSHIYYLDINPTFRKILELCNKLGIIKKAPIQLNGSLTKLKDEKGGNLYEKFLNDIMVITDKIMGEDIVKNRLVIEFGKTFNMDKLLLLFTLPVLDVIQNKVLLFHTALCHKRENFSTGTEFVVFFKKGPFAEYLIGYADTLNIQARYYRTIIKIPSHIKISSQKYFRFIIKRITIIRKTIFAGFAHHKKQINNVSNRQFPIEKEMPRISAIYTGKSINFDLKKRSDFFWFLASDIPRDNILVYFNGIEAPEPELSIDKMNKAGIRFVDLQNRTMPPGSMPVWNSTDTLKNTKDTLLKIFHKTIFNNFVKLNFIPLFYSINMYYFIQKYAYWFDYFESNNIKINLDQNIFFRDSCPKMLALEKTGGISVAYQYVNMNYSSEHGYRIFSDVLFLFGPDYMRTVKGCHSIINNLIYSGFITDYSFNRVKDDAQKLRNQLTDNGAKFIICYLDEKSSYDRMSLITPKTACDIYVRLINLVLSDETLGLICSPKNVMHFKDIMNLPEINETLQKGIKTGRLVVMDGVRQTYNFPTEVAQASDLCIGILLGGTAILEAYLSGTPSIFLDIEKLYSLNIYEWGKGKVVFDDINDMLLIINKFITDADSVPGFGNLDQWVKDKDAFKDGKASVRIGEYLKCLHDKLSEGESKKKAIEYANKSFTELWGKENIVKF